MAKKERIVTASFEELQARLAQGEDRTDWAKVKAMSQEEVERLADEEEGPLPEGWEKTIIMGFPFHKEKFDPELFGKEAIKLRIDKDVLNWFRESGRGYQTRMNNVLRAFVASQIKGKTRPSRGKTRSG